MRFTTLNEQDQFIDEAKTAFNFACKRREREREAESVPLRMRNFLHRVHNSAIFTFLLTLVIIATFINFILMAELVPDSGSATRNTLENLDLAFTIAYVVSSPAHHLFCPYPRFLCFGL